MGDTKWRRFKKRCEPLFPATPKPVCRICFKEFIPASFGGLLTAPTLCDQCFSKLAITHRTFEVDGVEIYALAAYREPLLEWLHQYKEELDIELAPIFFERFNSFFARDITAAP